MAKIKAGRTEAKAKKSQDESVEKHAGKAIDAGEGAIVVHAFPLGRDAGIISVSEYKNKKSLDLRRFYLGEDEKWHHTSKGIRIPAEQVESVLQALVESADRILDLLH